MSASARRSRRTSGARLVAVVCAALLGAGGVMLAARPVSATPATQLFATPTSLDFGDVVMESTSAPQQVHVTNVGTAAVKLSGTYGSSGPFTNTGNCIGTTLAKGATCVLNVVFTPTNPGSFSGTIVDTFNGVKVNVGVRGAGYAKFRVTPTSLDFGDTAISSISPAQAVTVTNVTSAPITVNVVKKSVSAAFGATQTCESTVLAPGGTCQFDFHFVSRTAGSVTATDAFTLNDESVAIKLTGNGVQALQITPTALDFGNVLLHTASPQQVVMITNKTGASLQMNGPPPSGSGSFSVSQDCQSTVLPPGGACHMYFHFTPSAIGAAAATVTGAWNGQSYSIDLAGDGNHRGAPAEPFRITPRSLDFGDAPLGTSAQSQDVTITNQTASPIVVSGTGGCSGGVFGCAERCQGTTLAPGASCTTTYSFSPTLAGTADATASGTFNGQQYAVTLHGVGTRKFLVTPLALEFGPTHIGSPQGQDVSFTNETGSAIVVDLRGGGAAGFGGKFDCPGHSTTLAAGASCTVTYAFAPLTPGRQTANSGGSTINGQALTYTLAGFGLADLAITPTGLAFAPQSVGTKSPAQQVFVRNVSGHSLTLDTTNNPAPANFLVTNTCGATLATGASCAYSVVFKPTATGTKTGTLQATINGQSLHVALTGKGK